MQFRASLLAAWCALCLAAAPASAATFSNPAPITINDSPSNCLTPPLMPIQSQATPYPSRIQVSGLTSAVTDVNVTLTRFSHTSVADTRVLLVNPLGQSTLVLDQVGQGEPASNVTFTFDDSASGPIPEPPAPIVSGTYLPTQQGTGCGYPASMPFPAPAPSGPYGLTLAGFNAIDPNGSWSLYAVDMVNHDVGAIAGGWQLDIAAPAARCKKKKKKHHASAAKKKSCKKKKRKK